MDVVSALPPTFAVPRFAATKPRQKSDIIVEARALYHHHTIFAWSRPKISVACTMLSWTVSATGISVSVRGL
ncbi:hypothetical protein AB1484_38360 [Parafrankia sp. FMc6]|uniref:hypothetical protein n=1 Tax=Parafrankia soli TaxID=2599596 RepID=UPI0034D639F9